MSRFKLLLFGFLAACALSAIASASASASCGIETGKFVFCDHTGHEIGTPPQLLLGLSGLSLLEGHVGGAALKIDCKVDHLNITVELLGKTKGSILFLECKVIVPVGCVVPPEITARFTDQLVGKMGDPEDEFTGSGAGEEFTELKVTECTIEGNYPVTGKQLVLVAKGEESSAEHEFIAKKAGSKLKVGAETASYSSTAPAKLESGLPWLIMLGT